MSSNFSQLSASFARLSSLERRFIILVLVIIFIVINLLFVLPHFSDLGKIDNRFGDANDKRGRSSTMKFRALNRAVTDIKSFIVI